MTDSSILDADCGDADFASADSFESACDSESEFDPRESVGWIKLICVNASCLCVVG